MNTWHNAHADPPPVGKRVIATDGVFVGEAYITTVGGVSAWHRSYHVPWEVFSQRPVIGWTEFPDAWGGGNE